MSFEDIIQQSLMFFFGETNNFFISRNKKRGQSITFTISNEDGRPVYIAKFFDYLVDIKGELGVENISKYEGIEDLLENIDSLEDMDCIQFDIETIIDFISFQQRCFKRYVSVCKLENLDCFPEVIYEVEEIKVGNSYYGFLIETYIDGITLEKTLPFSEEIDRGEKAFDFLIQLANVVKKLNSNGIVHRDISPDNIMCLGSDYVVIDPGMVKISDDNPATQSRMILGKLLYTSPEQYMGNAKIATFKSDLYAIGIIALEIVIGYNPLHKIIIEESKRVNPHMELLKRYDREIEDDFFDNVEENEFTSRILLIIKKLIQVEDNLRFSSIDSFILSVNSLKERSEIND